MVRSQLSFAFDHGALHQDLDEAFAEATALLGQMTGRRKAQQIEIGRRLVSRLRGAFIPHANWEIDELLPRLGRSHVASELRFEVDVVRRWLDELDGMLEDEQHPRLGVFRRRAHDLLVLLEDHLREESEVTTA